METDHPIKQINIDNLRVVDGKSFPKAFGPSTITSFYQLEQYFIKNHKEIVSQLNTHGALFFRGFDIKSPCQIASILNKLGLKSFEYIGGAAVRKLVVGRYDTNPQRSVEVFTTNEAPPSELIPFHNELLQTPNYPQYLGFYCYSQADTGGSTSILNSHQIYQYIANKYPTFVEKLQKQQIRYIRVVGAQDNPLSPIGRGWKNIFKVKNKQEAEKQMLKAQFQFKWLDNDNCQLVSKKLKAIRVSKSGKKVFCNQIIAVYKGWRDDKNIPQKCLKFGNFQDMPYDILNDITSHAETIKVSIPWKRNDFILIDNQMVAHAREPFTGKNRKIYACLFKGDSKPSVQPQLTLNSGDQMPVLGFGTWKIPKQQCSEVVYNAIKSGYRLIDCACDYGNEKQVGQGIKRAISQNLVKREELFITSKLWNTFHRPEHVRIALMKSLTDLGLTYLDLYLIHFPIAIKYVPIQTRYPPQWFNDPNSLNPYMEQDNVPIIQTWKAMQTLVKQGLIKNIGVSNFVVSLLRDLINSAQIQPSVLQVELHPYLTQKKLIRFCREKNIQITSYSTLGASSYLQLSMSTEDQSISKNQTVNLISKQTNKTPYQVVLRWAIQQGLAIIPKTSNINRLKENRDLLDWRLTNEQMTQIDNLNKNRRFNDPGVFCEGAFKTFFPIYD